MDNDIAIFWDFASSPAPSDRSGYIITSNIRLIAQEFGSVKLFKAYLAISDHISRGGRASDGLRSELQISGVSLTDVPEESALAQMLTVDLLLFALDRSPSTTRIILITENQAFLYAISILRLRNYPVIVISSSQGHPSLISQASLHFDWTAAVLRPEALNAEGKPASSLPSFSAKPPVQRRTGVGLSAEPPRTPATVPQLQPASQLNEEIEIETFLRQSRTPRTATPDELLPLRSAAFPTDLPFTPIDPAPSTSCQPFSTLEKEKGSMSSTPRRVPEAIGYYQKPGGIPPSQPPPFGRDEFLYKAPSSSSSEPRQTSSGNDAFSPSASSSQPQGNLAQRLDRATAPGVFSPQGTSYGSLPPTISPPAPSPRLSSCKTVPPAFQPLVDVLRSHRANGSFAPLRSSVALELATTYKDIYKKAGAEKFAQYSSKAVEEGIVIMGGSMGSAWIQLHPDLY